VPYKHVTKTVRVPGGSRVEVHRVPVCRCGSENAEERYSLGIYAGIWCTPCWKTSGYRDEPASGFDPLDAGEAYGEDDY